MKKIVLSILIATVLSASQYAYEVTPMIGYTFSNGGQDIRDHTTFAAQFQYNIENSQVNPEFSVLYGDVDRNDEGSGDVDIFRSTINGVHEFERYRMVTPLIKVGVGYETMSDHLYENQNGLFMDIGVGIKISLAKQIAFKMEAIEMQKYNHSQWDNNLVYLVGFSIAFN